MTSKRTSLAIGQAEAGTAMTAVFAFINWPIAANKADRRNSSRTGRQRPFSFQDEDEWPDEVPGLGR